MNFTRGVFAGCVMLLGLEGCGGGDSGFLRFTVSGQETDAHVGLEHFRSLAEGGDTEGQYQLGVLFADDGGGCEVLVTAYAWWDVAEASGHATARKSKSMISSLMTPEEIAEARALSVELRKKIEAKKGRAGK